MLNENIQTREKNPEYIAYFRHSAIAGGSLESAESVCANPQAERTQQTHLTTTLLCQMI